MNQPPAPDGDPGPEPGRGEGVPGGAGRDPQLSDFAPGGAAHGRPPGPELAAMLSAVSGPEWRCPGAEQGELIGILRRWSAIESWVGAAKLGVIRELICQDDLPVPARSRRRSLPAQWSDSLTHEVSLALASSTQSAGKLMWAAVELESRLPGTEKLLAGGTLTLPKAKLIAEIFQGLSDKHAARAEEILLPQLTGPTGKTFTQIERLAAAVADDVDPGLAERRREAAEQHQSRVEMFRERSGTAALSGRDLPTDETLAAYANVNSRAEEYKTSGAFPGARMDQLRAMAYLDLLNGVTADARIAHAVATARAGAEAGTDDQTEAAAHTAGQAGPRDRSDPCGPGDCTCGERDGCRSEPDDGPDGYGGPDDGGPDDGGPNDGGGPDDGGGTDDRGSDGYGGPDDGDGPNGDGSPKGGSGSSDDDGPDGVHALGGDARPGGQGSSDDGPGLNPGPAPDPLDRPAVADLIIPLLTLLGLAERPGEGHGLGPLDPGLCRDLAATAANWPGSRWCLTITDPDGVAIGHGCAKPARSPRHPPDLWRGPPRDPPQTSLAALPARVNLTIPLTALDGLRLPARPSRSPSSWAFALGGGPSTWVLTLPGGRELTITPEPVPAYTCDHRHESHAYKANDTLRHLVQVRDGECTFPPCSRHARESDFEHAVPYDQGGPTCACNAGARSRRCHRVKQSPGWTVTQPRPGWHQWTTPAGWTYVQGPKRYPA